jgi:hypothetical protein
MPHRPDDAENEHKETTVSLESKRLEEAKAGAAWRKWGPYLSERQWGTVREDYSESGNAWDYFSHDHARSRAYRWGEDGLAGYSDDRQRLCFALALWNGKDSILKERLFGLTNSEGNHGEDVKEYYFYLDSTPTHSYMKWLYKYPQRSFPYEDLVKTNRSRGRGEMEYELLDTGVFDDDRYFDVFVEYAKAGTDDTLIRITAANRGPDAAPLHILPTLWFRNTWSWGFGDAKPSLRAAGAKKGLKTVAASHPELGEVFLHVDGDAPLLFTENETNQERMSGKANASPFVKDGINNFVVDGRRDAVNGEAGTKVAPHVAVHVAPGASVVVRLRLSDRGAAKYKGGPFADFDAVFNKRVSEADAFFKELAPGPLKDDQRRVMRQAIAGMLWSKQYYHFDLHQWLKEHGADPKVSRRAGARNRDWFHMVNSDVISMPDKWEYPWYAAWDLAFHTLVLALVDIDFAKGQLDLMLREFYLHPNGQIPAYEWNFGDVNPPVHAWATYYVYKLEKRAKGEGDVTFLKHAFSKLLLNFTWWVNRKDPSGRNVFEGGFLGLDNIGVFDRSSPLPTGGFLEQADGTAWMAFYCQCMLDIALELTLHDPMYEDMATKFVEHFCWIASAMDRPGEHADEMWDEQDGFFYDLLRLPNGDALRLKVRSMVGLLPLCATTVFEPDTVHRIPGAIERLKTFMAKHPEMKEIAWPVAENGRRILSILTPAKLDRVLARLFDEKEFLGPHGIRSLSKYHEKNPYIFTVHGEQYRVDYLPAESNTGMFGGNSNWRGPVWLPVNALILRALTQYYMYFGDDHKVEFPTGSGNKVSLFEAAQRLAERLNGTFLRGKDGKRPVYGGARKFQDDPHWRDHILFYEYFHGDNGAGLGASHQTGWTGLVGLFLVMAGSLKSDTLYVQGRGSTLAPQKTKKT